MSKKTKTKLKAHKPAQKHAVPAAAPVAPALVTHAAPVAPAVLKQAAPAASAARRVLIEPALAEPTRSVPAPERKAPTLFSVWAAAPFAMMDMWFAAYAPKRERV